MPVIRRLCRHLTTGEPRAAAPLKIPQNFALKMEIQFSIAIILRYDIAFTVKNVEAFQLLYRQFKIYSQNNLWKGRQEQMRF